MEEIKTPVQLAGRFKNISLDINEIKKTSNANVTSAAENLFFSKKINQLLR